MKKKYGLIGMLSVLLLIGACRVHDPCNDCYDPPAPSGVWTITGDDYVEILWDELYIHDLDGYRIYRSFQEFGEYEQIGWSYDTYFEDDEVTNGFTYFYAVTAVDYNGNESDLSYESIFDTPRPEDWDLEVGDYDDIAGVDFSGYYNHMIQPWDDWDTDMYLFWDEDDGSYAFASRDVLIDDEVFGTDIQYAGYVDTLDELDWAPSDGWSTEVADVVNLYEGHAYWVWTWDNHFAKFRVTHIGDDYVVIDWAYQIDEGNPELVVIAGEGMGSGGPKPARPDGAVQFAPNSRENHVSSDNTLAGGR